MIERARPGPCARRRKALLAKAQMAIAERRAESRS